MKKNEPIASFSMIKVAVIIVTYNSSRFIDGCFTALAHMDRSGLDVEVVVVDNGFKDDALEKLKAYPWVTVIAAEKNLGFSGGNNLAMQRAMEAGADYVYLLNHDTEATPSFLVEAVRDAENDPRIGAAQSLLLLHPDKELINSTGNTIHFLGFGYCLEYRKPYAQWKAPVRKEIAYPSGAGVLFRTAVLRKVGVLDEQLFLYHEDLDLGWRIRLAGYDVVLVPRSVVYHKYEFSRSISKYYFMERNRYIVFMKNLRLWTLAVLAIPLFVSEIALLIASFRSGWWREKLKVYVYFFRLDSWKELARTRRQVQASRIVSDREIMKLFQSTINYQEVAGPFTRYVANPCMRVAWSVMRLCIF